jgi:uncharacterized membrane protein YbhN (UPF0104 family)
VPALAGGVRSAVGLVRGAAAVSGSLIHVTLDCATLVVAMRIVGQHPPSLAVVMACLISRIVSLIPVPGGSAPSMPAGWGRVWPSVGPRRT